MNAFFPLGERSVFAESSSHLVYPEARPRHAVIILLVLLGRLFSWTGKKKKKSSVVSSLIDLWHDVLALY